MTVWPVLVDNWQIECCGEPYSIGDEVRWQLDWLAADRSPLSPDIVVRRTVRVEHRSWSPPGVMLIDDGMTAWWRDAATPGLVDVHGSLHEEHHGGVPENLPATAGVVRRIRVLTQTYQLTPGGHSWTPVTGETTTRPVHRSPKWFDWDKKGRASGTASRAVEIGVVVDLDVIAADSARHTS